MNICNPGYYDIHPNWLTHTYTKETVMANKNPFEIRSEMLTLAKDYMDQQYHMNVSFAEKMMDAGKMQMEEFQKHIEMYSVEELMSKAKEMYSFVSDKGDSTK